MTVVVSDTSPLRALDHLKLTWLLQSLYGEVLIPPAVAQELQDPASALPPLDWRSVPGVTVRAPVDKKRVEDLTQTLDQGEAEAICLGLEVRASALLVDERAARAVAASLGLRPVGVLAVLVRAKELGHISEVRPLLDLLRTDIGFYISRPLYAEIVRLAGE